MEIRTARDAADLLGRQLPPSAEGLVVGFLDEAGGVLKLVSHAGGADAVDVPLREILGEGLRLGSRAMIVAHNHPSGRSAPSPGDIAATRRLADLADALGIRLHDHLIFAGDRCASMRALGLL